MWQVIKSAKKLQKQCRKISFIVLIGILRLLREDESTESFSVHLCTKIVPRQSSERK